MKTARILSVVAFILSLIGLAFGVYGVCRDHQKLTLNCQVEICEVAGF